MPEDIPFPTPTSWGSVVLYPWFFVMFALDVPTLLEWSPLQNLRVLYMKGGLSSLSLMASAFLVLAGLAGLVFPDQRVERPAEHERGELSL